MGPLHAMISSRLAKSDCISWLPNGRGGQAQPVSGAMQLKKADSDRAGDQHTRTKSGRVEEGGEARALPYSARAPEMRSRSRNTTFRMTRWRKKARSVCAVLQRSVAPPVGQAGVGQVWGSTLRGIPG
jgi:hypothetical protein